MASLSKNVTRATTRFSEADVRIRTFLGSAGVVALRVSIGLVFVWFGLLKVLDVSPVSDLVARSTGSTRTSWFRL